MSTNDVFNKGDQLSMEVPADTASSAAVLVGGRLPGVTLTAEGEGGNPEGYASVARVGVFNLPIPGTTAIAKYGPVYITPGGALTATATSNVLFGTLLEAKSTTANEVRPVLLAKV